MATHSSVLAWRIPGTGQPGGLLSMGSHRKKKKKKKKEPGGLQSMGSQKSRTQLSAKQQQYGLWVLGLWCLKVLGNSAPPRRL